MPFRPFKIHTNILSCVFVVLITQLNVNAQDSSVVVGYRSAKKAIKHNTTIPRLTYFIHCGDSLIQLFNVTISKKEENIELTGWEAPLEQKFLDVYQKIKNGIPINEFSAEEKLISNQVHIFDNSIRPNNGRILIELNQSQQYILYQGGKNKSRKLNWILPVAGGVGAVGLVALVIYGISKIVWG